jgi:hypothetical protein
MRIQTLGAALAASALLGTAGCSGEATGFTSGVEPWEVPTAATQAEWPDMPTTPGAVAVATGSRAANGDTPAHFWAHGRALVAASIADVWNALQWKQGAVVAVYPDDTVDCEPANGVESGYDLSYSVKETPVGGPLYRANWFLVHWRANATRDASQSVLQVNVKAQKVDGTTYIKVMRQSIVATPAPGGGTQLEIVRQINAPGESETTAGDWMRLWFDALDAQAKGAPLAPLSRCAFP